MIQYFYLTQRWDPNRYYCSNEDCLVPLFSAIPRTLVERCLKPLQRSSWCILQPQLAGLDLFEPDIGLISTSTLGQSGLGSTENEGVLHIFQSSKTRASPSDNLVSYLEHLLDVGALLLCRNAVSVFYSPSQQGCLRPVLPG